MNALIVSDEATIRLTAFLLLFLALAIAERLAPRRTWSRPWQLRWVNNIGLSLFNSVLLRFLAPFSGTALAVIVQDKGWAVLNLSELPLVWSVLIFVLIFDCTIYFQHRMFHWIKPLWIFHRVHHTDLDYDVTTGTRFHPVSIIVSMAIKLVLVFMFGAEPLAILTAEVLLNATSMFNHSNIRIPEKVDRILRLFVVTPDMHRVHHSVLEEEHSCNFGFNFPWWDRLFGTYLAKASLTHPELQIGIEGCDEKNSVRLDHLLIQPFLSRGQSS